MGVSSLLGCMGMECRQQLPVDGRRRLKFKRCSWICILSSGVRRGEGWDPWVQMRLFG